MREKYETLSLVVLKDIAKSRGIRHLSGLKKSEVIDVLCRQDEIDAAAVQTGSDGPDQVSAENNESVSSQDTGENAVVSSGNTADAGDASSRQAAGSSTVLESTSLPAEESTDKAAEYSTGGSSSDNNSRSAVRTRPAARNGRTPKAESAGRAEASERPNRPADRTDRNIRTERTAKVPRPDRTERAERTERADRTERTDRTERADRPDRTERAERTERTERETFDRPPMDLASLDSGVEVSGILEVLAEGYGFIRSDNYLPGENDVYVAPSQIRRFGLKTGDIISGNTRIRAQQEKFSALLYLKSINGLSPSEASRRYNFEDMTPIFPNQRMRMERSSREVASRIVDLFSPIGKGQRGMIVSPPKAGKTTLLKDIARSILRNEPDMHLLILLIDERPEEVTDIREAIVGDQVEVIYSTFDELPEHHKRVSEMGIERAKRLVEHGEDVTILLDSITRLARAYNLTVPPSGRTLSGGLDPAALHMPKRFFGAARNMREGGSLTILATALVDTGSKMDDVVYEEFKGTGNMELVLDRKLSERRIFPAIDIQKSSTRREDLLLTPDEQEAMYIMRRALNGMKSDEAVENILNMFLHTRDNAELVTRVRRQRHV